MNTICVLENPIQEYVWGSRTAIADLLGTRATDVPQAELWIGAHPKAPSLVEYGGRKIPLTELIERFPVEILGADAASRFNGRLPYLLKVLAAEKPLSIQAHPNKMQAEAGFERENRLGIALTAPDRNYRDANHKPECICALTPFWALRGFRPVSEMLPLLSQLCPVGLQTELAALEGSDGPEALKAFFYRLITLNAAQKQQLIAEIVSNAKKIASPTPCHNWVLRLHASYPADIGILSPVVLNLVCLQPGEAMFLPSGELHAYLDGVGMELMANSDNVLRGGLTPKHVDVPELLRVLNFEERRVDILSPREMTPCERRYECPAEEFSLSVISPSDGNAYVGDGARSVEILFCTAGNARITDQGDGQGDGKVLELAKGRSLLVPASVSAYKIEGSAVIYKAAVPI